jgi:hypothetical protein
MASEYARIDISNVPDMLKLAEDVNRTRRPRILRRANEDIAVLMPMQHMTRRPTKHAPSAEDIAAFEAAAGGWKDVDVDRFLADNARSRQTASRPPVDL